MQHALHRCPPRRTLSYDLPSPTSCNHRHNDRKEDKYAKRGNDVFSFPPRPVRDANSLALSLSLPRLCPMPRSPPPFLRIVCPWTGLSPCQQRVPLRPGSERRDSESVLFSNLRLFSHSGLCSSCYFHSIATYKRSSASVRVVLVCLRVVKILPEREKQWTELTFSCSLLRMNSRNRVGMGCDVPLSRCACSDAHMQRFCFEARFFSVRA